MTKTIQETHNTAMQLHMKQNLYGKLPEQKSCHLFHSPLLQ